MCGGASVAGCGGAKQLKSQEPAMRGLSPRVRGSRSKRAERTEAPRSIPACAGEPVSLGGAVSGGSVYPRVCGGAGREVTAQVEYKGLSPRVRGSHPMTMEELITQWSIPACAGEPRDLQARQDTLRVYPRVCGGAFWMWALLGQVAGLSPRVRGSQRALRYYAKSLRSIPACAGEPTRGQGKRRRGWVYPRVCGGAPLRPGTFTSTAGLSPRVRGSPWAWRTRPHWSRSIPACAGEPEWAPHLVAYVPCGSIPACAGEPRRLAIGAALVTGLSPRVRGSLDAPCEPVRPARSIPACAGEPRADERPERDRRLDGLSPRVRGSPNTPTVRHGHRRVYPRVCGGATQAQIVIIYCAGLSPRVRGSHRMWNSPSEPGGVYPRVCGGAAAWTDRRPGTTRSIPACAGEPPSAPSCKSRLPSRVYPRVCGGALPSAGHPFHVKGLSPRVRGSPIPLDLPSS